MERICDLHVHSCYSDSDNTVEEIFRLAKEKRLSCLALTDHDTTAGLAQARHYSQLLGIELINAIEISAQKDNAEVHILGYFIDPQSRALEEALSNIKELRKERLILMLERLNALGLRLDKEEVLERIKDNMPTRLHLGLFLIEKKLVSSLRQAFRKYLSPGKPAYIARFKYSVKEAINLIKESKGLAFLAHPHLLVEQAWIEEFISYGLDGIEVVYPSFSSQQQLIYKNMAEKFGLLKSGGSDAHGSYKEFTGVGEVYVPYLWVEQMKQRLKI